MLQMFRTDSTCSSEHRSRLLDGYAASTVFRYMQAIQLFSRTLSEFGWDSTRLTQSQLVDTMSVMSQSRVGSSDGVSGNFTIQTLLGYRTFAGVRCLALAVSFLVDYCFDVEAHQRREGGPAFSQCGSTFSMGT